MPSLKDIRLRIKSVKNTQQVTKAMKMVSAAKLRKAQESIIKLRPYASKLKEMLGNLANAVQGEYESPFTKERKIKKTLLVVITSNRGLAGAFNSNITKSVVELAQGTHQEQYLGGNLDLICVGKKGVDFFSRRKFNLIGGNNDLFTGINFNTVNELASKIMEDYKNGEYDRVQLVYNEFKNVALQVRVVEQWLPVALDAVVVPEKGGGVSAKSNYIFEPDVVSLLDNLMPQILKMQFYKAVLESNASEHAARMVAMDKASTNAQELLGALQLSFNKARQAAITKEILEIVGGAEALTG